jgi:hypothetical protein
VVVGHDVKHTDSNAAVLGATTGALGAASTLDLVAMLRGSEDLVSGRKLDLWVAQASKMGSF